LRKLSPCIASTAATAAALTVASLAARSMAAGEASGRRQRYPLSVTTAETASSAESTAERIADTSARVKMISSQSRNNASARLGR